MGYCCILNCTLNTMTTCHKIIHGAYIVSRISWGRSIGTNHVGYYIMTEFWSCLCLCHQTGRLCMQLWQQFLTKTQQWCHESKQPQVGCVELHGTQKQLLLSEALANRSLKLAYNFCFWPLLYFQGDIHEQIPKSNPQINGPNQSVLNCTCSYVPSFWCCW